MSSLELQPPEVATELRQDQRLRSLLVQASAVQETEVLLGLKPAAGQHPHAQLVKQVEADEYDEVKRLLDEGCIDLLQRDPHGNMPIHYCRSMNIYKLLAAVEPQAAEARNRRGASPLEELLERCGSPEVLKDFWTDGGGPPKGEGERAPMGPGAAKLLELDTSGVSQVMRQSGKTLEWFLEQITPWEDFAKQFKMPDSLPESLDKLVPEGHWREVLAVHLFGEQEVWKEGKMAAQCASRLEEMWSSLKPLFQMVLKRNPEAQAWRAMDALFEILRAAHGPQKLADAREPYRKELSLEMLHLALQSEAIHDILYDMNMSGQAASWLKSCPDEYTWQRLDPFGKLKTDQVQRHRQRPKLRMDFQLHEGGRHVAAPAWVHTNMDFDFSQVLRDLRHVGGRDLQRCLGEQTFGNSDAVYRLLACKHGFGPDTFPSQLGAFCDPANVFWYTAWLRGLCEGRRNKLADGLWSVLQHMDPPPKRATGIEDEEAMLLFPSEAMGLQQLCEAVLKEMHGIYEEIRDTLVPEGPQADVDPELEEVAGRLMSGAPSFVVGINLATLVVEDAEAIQEAFHLLKQSSGGIVQVENRFHKKAPRDDIGECRRLLLWVPVRSDSYGPLVVQVTMLTADDHRENKWHRLPLEYFSGRLDCHDAPDRPTKEALEKYMKTRFQLNPGLIPERKGKGDGEVDKETERKMRELMERKAKEEERKRMEEERKRREEHERKLKEACAAVDMSQCEVIGNCTIMPPMEVLPKTKRGEEREMRKLEEFNRKKAERAAAEAQAQLGNEDEN